MRRLTTRTFGVFCCEQGDGFAPVWNAYTTWYNPEWKGYLGTVVVEGQMPYAKAKAKAIAIAKKRWPQEERS